MGCGESKNVVNILNSMSNTPQKPKEEILEKNLEEIVKNIYNVEFLEKKYPQFVSEIYRKDFNNPTNDIIKYHLLLMFPPSRKHLFLLPKKRHILSKTEDGNKVLIDEALKCSPDEENIAVDILLTNGKGCELILYSRLKEHLLKTEFSRHWALHYNTDSRKVLMENNETRKLLLTTDDGCYDIFSSDYKYELTTIDFSCKWALTYHNTSRKILLLNEESRKYLLTTRDGCVTIFGSEYKNELCNTDFSCQWALYYHDTSIKILLGCPEKRHMLLDDPAGCRLLLFSEHKNLIGTNNYSLRLALDYNEDSRLVLFNNGEKSKKFLMNSNSGKMTLFNQKCYDYFDNPTKMYFCLYHQSYDIIDSQLIDFIMENMLQGFYFYKLVIDDKYPIQVHKDKLNFDLNGYNGFTGVLLEYSQKCNCNDKYGSGYIHYDHCNCGFCYSNSRNNTSTYCIHGYTTYGYHKTSEYNRDGYSKYGHEKNKYGFKRDRTNENGCLFKIVPNAKDNIKHPINFGTYMTHDEIISYLCRAINKKHSCYNKLSQELFKHECFYQYLMEFNIDIMLQKESSCKYLLEQQKYNDLLKTEYGKDVLLTREVGRNLLLQHKCLDFLVKTEEGIKLMMKNNYQMEVFEYKQNITTECEIGFMVHCPLCRQENDKYKKMSNNEECCVCMDRNCNVKFTKCRHFMCKTCLDKMKPKTSLFSFGSDDLKKRSKDRNQ
jgi:hypothetical protein